MQDVKSDQLTAHESMINDERVSAFRGGYLYSMYVISVK